MKLHAFLFLGAGLMLAGCGSRIAPNCPSAAILSDTQTVTGFRAGAPRDPSGEAYTAVITTITTICKYPKASPFSTSTLHFSIRAVRAPSADGADFAVPYFFAITQGDRVLSKQDLTAHLVFGPGGATASQDVDMDDLITTLEPGHPPTDYQFLVGFQLSDADRAYNRTRGRYAP